MHYSRSGHEKVIQLWLHSFIHNFVCRIDMQEVVDATLASTFFQSLCIWLLWAISEDKKLFDPNYRRPSNDSYAKNAINLVAGVCRQLAKASMKFLCRVSNIFIFLCNIDSRKISFESEKYWNQNIDQLLAIDAAKWLSCVTSKAMFTYTEFDLLNQIKSNHFHSNFSQIYAIVLQSSKTSSFAMVNNWNPTMW